MPVYHQHMSDLKLFRIESGKAVELEGVGVAVEKSLQTQMENHLEVFLGVRFLASEYSTGKTHAGRIDTLGLDENGCPVIIEYKRATNQNVINQGLFYLDWLMDHKAEFKLLVLERFGDKAAQKIEWSSPRLLCIAGDFTNYDEHAVAQINRQIELLRYKRFGPDLLLLELVNAPAVVDRAHSSGVEVTPTGKQKTITQILSETQGELRDLYEALRAHLNSMGDDVQEKTLALYIAFRRIKNFACVELRLQKKEILIYAKVDPTTVQLEEGFTRDVRNVGHYGTGDLEIVLRNGQDLERAKPLLQRSYELS
jgi:predicted transport protein